MVQVKIVVNPAAKLGHTCECGGGPLFQGDEGLRCPNCHTVFVAKEPPKAKANKKEEE